MRVDALDGGVRRIDRQVSGSMVPRDRQRGHDQAPRGPKRGHQHEDCACIATQTSAQYLFDTGVERAQMNLLALARYYLFAEPVHNPSKPPCGRARTKALAHMLGLSSRHQLINRGVYRRLVDRDRGRKGRRSSHRQSATDFQHRLPALISVEAKRSDFHLVTRLAAAKNANEQTRPA